MPTPGTEDRDGIAEPVVAEVIPLPNELNALLTPGIGGIKSILLSSRIY
jgi:hypothetical protein